VQSRNKEKNQRTNKTRRKRQHLLKKPSMLKICMIITKLLICTTNL